MKGVTATTQTARPLPGSHLPASGDVAAVVAAVAFLDAAAVAPVALANISYPRYVLQPRSNQFRPLAAAAVVAVSAPFAADASYAPHTPSWCQRRVCCCCQGPHAARGAAAVVYQQRAVVAAAAAAESP